MLEEIIFAGFGGQGVLSLGQTLTYAGMVDGREVCWMPSYGPEMRGGTANCAVSISSDPISSPILAKFDAAIILNNPSFEKFEPRIKAGGVLVYDSTNVTLTSKRTDIVVLAIPASAEANKLGNARMMGMILLGAYLKQRPVLPLSAVTKALEKVLPERYHNLIPLNHRALEAGAAFAKN